MTANDPKKKEEDAKFKLSVEKRPFVMPLQHEEKVRKFISWVFDTVKYAAIIGAVQATASQSTDKVSQLVLWALAAFLFLVFIIHINIATLNYHVTVFQTPKNKLQHALNRLISLIAALGLYFPVYVAMNAMIGSLGKH